MKNTVEAPVFYKIKATSKLFEGINGYEAFNEGDYVYGTIMLEYPSDTKDLNEYMNRIIPLAIVKDEKYLQDIILINEEEFVEALNNKE